VAFSKDDSIIAVADLMGIVRLFKPGSWSDPQMLLAHTDEAWGLACSPTENLLASASTDGNVKLWDAASTPNQGVLQLRTGAITRVQFSPTDGKTLAVGFETGTVQFWDVATKTERFQIEGEMRCFPTFLCVLTGREEFRPDQIEKTVQLLNFAQNETSVIRPGRRKVMRRLLARQPATRHG
jgi:WD40 repeat protein